MLYLFDDYALDTERRELRRGDAQVAVEPKVFDLLMYLVENRQRVVSRDDLIANVWDGRIVSESAIGRCINGARSAIDDSGEAQRWIKTVQRKGLRFVGEVREEQAPASAAGARSGPKMPGTAPVPLDRPSIAVLPFDNASGDPAQDYLSDGISEDIITDAGTGAHRWAERYDRQFADIFAIQDEMARTIAPILAAHVNKAEIERTLNKPPASWQAYDYYLRAVHLMATYFSSLRVADLYEVRRLLEQSLALDPGYAPACVKLARTYFNAWINPLDGDHLNPAALDRAFALARKAVELDHMLPEAHAVLGHVVGRRGEHDAAIAAFERAFALNPNFTDWRFAENLVWAGEPERALAAIDRLMQIDPSYEPLALVWVGAAHYMLRAYPRALPSLQECVSRAPDLRSGHLWLAATYAQLGRLDDARTEAAEVLRIDPECSIQGKMARIYVFRRPEDAEHLRDGLRKAGLRD